MKITKDVLEESLYFINKNRPYFMKNGDTVRVSESTEKDIRIRFDVTLKQIVEKDWDSLFSDMRDPYMLHLFLLVIDDMDEKSYWKILRKLLIDNPFTIQYEEDLALLLLKYNHRIWNPSMSIMNNYEKQKMAQTKLHCIYKGCYEGDIKKIRWWLKKDDAIRDALSLEGKSNVYQAVIDRVDVLAYFNNDKSVYVQPERVTILSVPYEFNNQDGDFTIEKLTSEMFFYNDYACSTLADYPYRSIVADLESNQSIYMFNC